MENPVVYKDFTPFELGDKYLVNIRYKEEQDLSKCDLIEIIDDFIVYTSNNPLYFNIVGVGFYGLASFLRVK